LILMVRMRLEANGYDVVSAEDGQEGLEKVKSEKPDLIILDIMMPVMDGFELCSIIKEDEQTRKIPVIILTGRAQDTDSDTARKLGADSFLKKPFDAPVLLAKIEELLKK